MVIIGDISQATKLYFVSFSTSQGKYGLQWQQPFLELVLACMKPQRVVHEELLSPLQKQLQNFLTAFEKVHMFNACTFEVAVYLRMYLYIQDKVLYP